MLDPAGDSATFLTFLLPDKDKTDTVANTLRAAGAPATRWSENSWHYYPNWEHLLEGKTPCSDGWPFALNGKRRYVYDPKALPKTVAILERALTYQVPVRLAQEQETSICAALAQAGRAI